MALKIEIFKQFRYQLIQLYVSISRLYHLLLNCFSNTPVCVRIFEIIANYLAFLDRPQMEEVLGIRSKALVQHIFL